MTASAADEIAGYHLEQAHGYHSQQSHGSLAVSRRHRPPPGLAQMAVCLGGKPPRVGAVPRLSCEW